MKTETTVLEIKPEVFVAKSRKQASKALALRDRGKARIRFAKKPTKKDGNPFFAVRCAPQLLKAFKAYAKKQNTTPTQLVRDYMSKVTGVEVGE